MRKLESSDNKMAKTSAENTSSPSWMDWTKQLHAYVAWVNSQFRKRSGCRLVSDLRKDFRDGTAFANLIEIVSSSKITGIDYKPFSAQSKRQNVEKVLSFMSSQNITLHGVTAKDINDGNLKSIMRLILAIAKHYKPSSISSAKKVANSQHQSVYGSLDTRRVPVSPSSYRGLTIMPNYSATPSMDYGNRQMSLNRVARTVDPLAPMSSYRSLSWSSYRSLKDRMMAYDDGDYAGTDSDVSDRNSPVFTGGNVSYSLSPLNERLVDGRGEVDGASCISSPAPSVSRTPINNISSILTPAKSLPCLNKANDREGYRDYENYPMYGIDGLSSSNKTYSAAHLNKLLRQPNEAVEVRNQGTSTFGGTPAEDKLAALQSYLYQTSEKCHDLQSSLKKAKQECATLEDVKSDLHCKVVEQDKSLLEMKQELSKLNLTKKSLEAEKEELARSLDIKEQQLMELRRQLENKDKLVQQQKNQFDDAVRNLTIANKSKACLTARLADQDRKIALLEQARSHKTPMREELQVVRDALQSLRNSFKRNEPQHHTIDTLEQSFALLMERLHLADIQKLTSNQGDTKRLNFDSTGDPRRVPLTTYQGLNLQKLDNVSSTKVVYFTEKTMSPFMSSIPKRLGEITLQDFKTMFDRPGNYRFHFKSVDPEYGMVKEEIMHDDNILPGWDGKIIAWVEEDHG